MIQCLFYQFPGIDSIHVHCAFRHSFTFDNGMGRVEVDNGEHLFFQTAKGMNKIIPYLRRRVQVAFPAEPFVKIASGNCLHKMNSQPVFRPDALDLLQCGKGCFKYRSQAAKMFKSCTCRFFTITPRGAKGEQQLKHFSI